MGNTKKSIKYGGFPKTGLAMKKGGFGRKNVQKKKKKKF